MKLGAHVSIAGGLDKAVQRAKEMGAQAIQIFGSSPQSFRTPNYVDADFDRFNRSVGQEGISPIFFHGVYLVNLASDSPRLYELSIQSLIFYLRLCEKMPVEGVIFHIGSHKGMGFTEVRARVIEAGRTILSETERGKLILENNAGQGGGVGARFEEIADIINNIGSDRVAVCLDSQHAFAAGYSIHTNDGLEKTLADFDETIGLERLVAVHLNDSKFPLGSQRDRHENIGQGLIGLEGFRRLLNHSQLSRRPFIIETPGFENRGPDRENLGILRSLI